MASTDDLKKDKIRLILTIVSITLLAVVVVFLLVRSMSNEGQLHQSELERLNQKIKSLNQNLGTLQNQYLKTSKDRDSLKNHVDYYWPLRSLVHNAKLRDQVGVNLKLKPGDLAIMKTDSTRVVVTEIKVGGNDLNYYINYLVKNSKGEIKEVSPYEVDALNPLSLPVSPK